jgi:hypothetical protein
MARATARRWLWFAALWAAGVAVTGAVGYALRWVMMG